jgi:hypothetical protein
MLNYQRVVADGFNIFLFHPPVERGPPWYQARTEVQLAAKAYRR